jgi:hypothetical protein
MIVLYVNSPNNTTISTRARKSNRAKVKLARGMDEPSTEPSSLVSFPALVLLYEDRIFCILVLNSKKFTFGP